MSKQTELILIRHGQTDWNAYSRIQGHIDIPLNAAGIAQVQALGARFISEGPQMVYSSDLERAYRTALAVVNQKDVLIRRDARLRERNLGVLEGLTREEAIARQPSAWQTFKSRSPDTPLEGGESLRAFFERVSNLLTELLERHQGERVVLVTHGGVLDAAYRHATGMPLNAPRQFPIHNASINTLIHSGGRWRVESWGDVAHLAAVAREAR